MIAAKMIKLEERSRDAQAGRPNRVRAKDALDVFRLLRVVETDELAQGFIRHRAEPHAERVSAAAIAFLSANGTAARSLLPTLAMSEIRSDPTVAASFAILTIELLEAIGM